MIYVIYVIYAVIGILLYLIINWLLNNSHFSILEGIEATKPAPAAPAAAGTAATPSPAAPAAAGTAAKPAPAAAGTAAKPAPAAAAKCPEDCTSVKELQSKLNIASKNVTSLEANINANNLATQQHAESIKNLNEAIAELQANGTDE
jgi:predicted lipid-binding transport protein (Tim44 family)